MIQRKLTKQQGYVIDMLAQQSATVQAQLAAVREALDEQAIMLRESFHLPEGRVQFTKDGGEWSLILTPSSPQDKDGDGDTEDALEKDREPEVPDEP